MSRLLGEGPLGRLIDRMAGVEPEPRPPAVEMEPPTAIHVRYHGKAEDLAREIEANVRRLAVKRRACRLDDLAVTTREGPAGGWCWSCRNPGCPHHGWDATGAGPHGHAGGRVRMVDAAREHVLGVRPCRPRVTPGVRNHLGRPWLWVCDTHPPPLGGYQGVAPSVGEACDAAVGHLFERGLTTLNHARGVTG